MTTAKKLAFCCTCTVVLLGVTPKMVAKETLKSTMKIEKEETNVSAETKVDDSAAKLIRLSTIILQYLVAAAGGGIGIKYLEKILFKKGPKQHHISNAYCGLTLTAGAFGAMIWALKDTFGPLLKQVDTKKR